MYKNKTLLFAFLITILFLNVLLIPGSRNDKDNLVLNHGDENPNSCTPTKELTMSTADGEMAYDQDEYMVEKNICYEFTFINTNFQEHDLIIDPNDEVGFEGIHLHLQNNTAGPYNNGTISTTAMTPNTDTELPIYCSIGSHRSQGMEAVLIVGEGNKGLLSWNYSFIILALAFMVAVPIVLNKYQREF